MKNPKGMIPESDTNIQSVGRDDLLTVISKKMKRGAKKKVAFDDDDIVAADPKESAEVLENVSRKSISQPSKKKTSNKLRSDYEDPKASNKSRADSNEAAKVIENRTKKANDFNVVLKSVPQAVVEVLAREPNIDAVDDSEVLAREPNIDDVDDSAVLARGPKMKRLMKNQTLIQSDGGIEQSKSTSQPLNKNTLKKANTKGVLEEPNDASDDVVNKVQKRASDPGIKKRVVEPKKSGGDPLKKNTLKKVLRSSADDVVDDFEDHRCLKRVKLNPSKANTKVVLEEPNDAREHQEDRKVTKKSLKKLTFDRGFSTQSRPLGLSELVSQFNEVQKADLESIGFGGLLKINFMTKVSHSLVRWLVGKFNGASRMLTLGECGRFVVTPFDICDVFLLPTNTGNRVVEVYGEKSDLEKYFSDKYSIDSGTSIVALKNLLQSGFPEGGEDFKRSFVLYALSTFLIPTANRNVSFRAGNAIFDVSNIIKFDWSLYVLEELCEAIRKYNSSNVVNCSGCVVALGLLYFHRLKWRGFSECMTPPLIEHWTSEKFSKRMSEEIAGGGFGDGELILNVYPISKKNPYEQVAVSEGEPCMSDAIPSTSQRFIKFDLMDDVPDDATIHKQAKDKMHEKCLIMKRDLDVVTRHHLKFFLEMKSKNPVSPSPKVTCAEDSPIASESQTSFFYDPAFHKWVDDVVDHCTRMNLLADGMPSFDLLSPEPIPEYRDCGLEDRGKGLASSDGVIDSGIDEGNVDVSMDESVGYVSYFMTTYKNSLSSMDSQEKEIVDYCLFDYGAERKLECLFRFRCANSVQNKDDDYMTSLSIPRDDMQSLNVGRKIFSTVVDCWSLLLNSSEAVDGCGRFVFGTGHSLYLSTLFDDKEKLDGDKIIDLRESIRGAWSVWLQKFNVDFSQVQMIFIPILFEDHYICGVINIPDKKIQYLDNRKWDYPDTFERAVRIVVEDMSVFMGSRNHANAVDILSYVIENVPFAWQSKKQDVDCGVYLMHHMKHFHGSAYSSPNLGKAAARHAMRAEVCAKLVSSPINSVRSSVLKKVQLFHSEKPELRKKISVYKRRK